MFVDGDVKESRLRICRACPEFAKTTATCKVCGCFMKIKTTLKTANCPKDKWNDTK